MFDTLDTALFYARAEHAYFFKGDSYIKYHHSRGVVLLSGREVRRIGIDGWQSFPDEFRSDLDASLFYSDNGHAYFFKGNSYIKYEPGGGVVPLANGSLIRRIGEDDWDSFPASFARGIDAAIFYPDNGHAYFFKGSEYIKYRPGQGVVKKDGRKIRTIGVDGWPLPPAFCEGVDAAMDYAPNGKVYFFRERDYLRYEPREGVDPRYPRRLGLLHRDHGGWPGLSHVVSGPLIGPVTDSSAAIWIWLTDRPTADAVTIDLRGGGRGGQVAARDVAFPEITGAMDAINDQSCMRVFDVTGLNAATDYTARVLLANQELDRVTFRTSVRPEARGQVRFGIGSCSDMSKNRDVPAFEAMANAKLDFALFCGDNCYYQNADNNTQRTGSRPRDWESTQRMLVRQIEARNHPQFTRLSREVPCYSTWDDHDFGYNNAEGTDLFDSWVGRNTAGAVFRAMWPNPYLLVGSGQAIYYSFRAGPVETFVTDNRFHKDGDAKAIWGEEQLAWLIETLSKSEAPVKVVVISGQFLFNRDDQEGHAEQAPDERDRLLDAVLGIRGRDPAVQGRVLFVSGDVHYSELFRYTRGSRSVLEFTSSPLRRDLNDDDPPREKEPGSRIWAAKKNGFGVVTVDVQSIGRRGEINGTITIEARDSDGDIIRRAGRDCLSVWDLATGDVS